MTHEVVWGCCCAPSDINIVFGTGCIIERLIPEPEASIKASCGEFIATWLSFIERSGILCSSLYGVLLTARASESVLFCPLRSVSYFSF